MYYICTPIEMQRQMLLDYNIIDQFLHNRQPQGYFTGIWETYQGEMYVKEQTEWNLKKCQYSIK